jgi:type VI secretion system protein ImpE
MTAKELLAAGKPAEALQSLQNEVRSNPNDSKLRVFLFQLLAVMGQWERAATQLKVSNDQDPGTLLMAQVCGPALAAENLRTEIFAGTRSPLLLGEPEEWIGWLLQANKHFAAGEFAAATELREKAFEAAPTSAGTINDQPFEWIADADQRFGPMLEAIIDGKYYWVPFSRIKQITMEAPADLRDLVWVPAIIMLSAGAQKVALLPVRYPGTEASGHGPAMMSRATEWADKGGISVGLGQRLLATDASETPLLEVRKITLNTVAPQAPADKGTLGAPAGAEG